MCLLIFREETEKTEDYFPFTALISPERETSLLFQQKKNSFSETSCLWEYTVSGQWYLIIDKNENNILG